LSQSGGKKSAAGRDEQRHKSLWLSGEFDREDSFSNSL